MDHQLDHEGLSASRIRQAFNVLAAALDAAVANGMLVRNVARGVELPRMARPERLFLSADQLGRLSDAIEEHLQALVLVLGYGGLRWGEAAALRRGRCDLGAFRRGPRVAGVMTENRRIRGIRRVQRRRTGIEPASGLSTRSTVLKTETGVSPRAPQFRYVPRNAL